MQLLRYSRWLLGSRYEVAMVFWVVCGTHRRQRALADCLWSVCVCVCVVLTSVRERLQTVCGAVQSSQRLAQTLHRPLIHVTATRSVTHPAESNTSFVIISVQHSHTLTYSYTHTHRSVLVSDALFFTVSDVL